MDDVILYNIIGLVLVTLPIFLLYIFGPEITKQRLSYGVVGLVVAGFIGLLLFLFAADTRYDFTEAWHGRLARDLTAAITEELIRYPGIILAEYITFKYVLKQSKGGELDKLSENIGEERVVNRLSEIFQGNFTEISDPHGMGLFFGVGYGMGETIAFYMIPTIGELITGKATFIVGDEVIAITLRITAVMAHVALTYLAMAITSQRGFWRITILLHLSSNFVNRVFLELGPNVASVLVFTMFTRFAIVTIAYFLLRPKIRYLSPAVLILILVSLFLLTILISTIVALLIGFLTTILSEIV